MQQSFCKAILLLGSKIDLGEIKINCQPYDVFNHKNRPARPHDRANFMYHKVQ